MAMQYPYLGKESLEEKEKEKLGTEVVKKLTNNYIGDHRTVYMDSFFSDFDLSQYLLQNKMYSVGTCNSNRRFIPTTFKKNSRKRDIGAVYVYHDQMTLVNFKEKKNRNAVNVISTKHIGLQKEEVLPNIVKNYRKYMGGVDRFDQLCGNYTVQRCS
uniref:DDE_Tnp_1_7 domain-containing protein n=1 Tax=Strongyloides papillosus TaxID=174720 RepID=A0A0N5B7M3_STREA